MTDTQDTAGATGENAGYPNALPFKYVRPELEGRAKRSTRFPKTDRLISGIQIVGEGGENNLHSHTKMDGFWFVLSGQATFYTTDDEVVATLGPHEGVIIPRNFPYWFEATGDQLLEILQVEALLDGKTVGRDRIDHAPQTAAVIAGTKEKYGRADAR